MIFREKIITENKDIEKSVSLFLFVILRFAEVNILQNQAN